MNLISPITLLIAEDDDGHAELIRLHLLEIGINYSILRFHDGQELIDFLFKNRAPTRELKQKAYLLLLDIHMPKMDGVEVLQKIKSSSYYNKMPVIILSTTDDPDEIKRCYAFGCNNYLTKPIEFGAFAETIKCLGLFLKILKVPTLGKGE